MIARPAPRHAPIAALTLAIAALALATFALVVTVADLHPDPCDKADRYLEEARTADRAGNTTRREELTDLFVLYETQCNTNRGVSP